MFRKHFAKLADFLRKKLVWEKQIWETIFFARTDLGKNRFCKNRFGKNRIGHKYFVGFDNFFTEEKVEKNRKEMSNNPGQQKTWPDAQPEAQPEAAANFYKKPVQNSKQQRCALNRAAQKRGDTLKRAAPFLGCCFEF